MFSGLSKRIRERFSSPAPSEPQGIALRPRDCHTHVLPGVDDGSRNMEESLAMLALLQTAGATKVVATPHIYPNKFPNEPEPLTEVFRELQMARDRAQIPVELELGAEHYLDASLPGRIQDRAVLSFGEENYLLFETSTSETVPVDLYPAIHAMRAQGYTPLLAHIERYRWLRGESGEDMMADLRAAGVRFQVNRTVGKVNVPGRGSRGMFLSRIIELDWIDEVGSDLHRPTPEGRPYAQ